MPTKRETISVRVDSATKRRVEIAAHALKQSSGAFLENAGDDRARNVLLEWAAERHRQGHASYSELAAETGVAVDDLMQSMGGEDRAAAFAAFLASCRAVAEANNDPGFLRAGEEAVANFRGEEHGSCEQENRC
jgi:hypothetical protein